MDTGFNSLHVDMVLYMYINQTHLHLGSWVAMSGALPLLFLHAFVAESGNMSRHAFTSLGTQLTFPELGHQVLG
jgi:hypothetical protein